MLFHVWTGSRAHGSETEHSGILPATKILILHRNYRTQKCIFEVGGCICTQKCAIESADSCLQLLPDPLGDHPDGVTIELIRAERGFAVTGEKPGAERAEKDGANPNILVKAYISGVKHFGVLAKNVIISLYDRYLQSTGFRLTKSPRFRAKNYPDFSEEFVVCGVGDGFGDVADPELLEQAPPGRLNGVDGKVGLPGDIRDFQALD